MFPFNVTICLKKPGQTSPVVSRIPILVRTKLRAVSFFFLVRWAKRTRHENDHAGDWRRGLRAHALPSLNLKRETARRLEVSPNISWKDKNFVFKITRPARQPVLTFGKRPCRGQYSLNKGLLASMIDRQSKHVTNSLYGECLVL